MHLGKTLALACLSASSALSFKIKAYGGPNCTGNTKEINVWDNTCRDTDVISTQSFEVLSYGAGRQRAGFYSQHSCVPSGPFVDYFADGGSDKFLKGRCINVGFEAHAFGSRSV